MVPGSHIELGGRDQVERVRKRRDGEMEDRGTKERRVSGYMGKEGQGERVSGGSANCETRPLIPLKYKTLGLPWR